MIDKESGLLEKIQKGEQKKQIFQEIEIFVANYQKLTPHDNSNTISNLICRIADLEHPSDRQKVIDRVVSTGAITKAELISRLKSLLDKPIEENAPIMAIKPVTFSPHGLYPDTGFLGDYLRYASPVTDAPLEFHVATALSVLSIVAGRNIYMQVGHKKLYPNLWIMILAASGIMRKTTSQDIGKELIYKVEPNLIGSNEFTREAIVQDLAERPTLILMHSEMSNLLSQLEREYNKGLKNMLTELYDCPDFYNRKLKNETSEIKNPYLCILGASTIEWLIDTLKEGDLRSGFLARFLYLSAYEKSDSKALPPKPDYALKDELIMELNKIREISGEIVFSPDARTLYESWYYQQEEELNIHPQRDLLSSFYVRLIGYCKKIAMLYALNDKKTYIEANHFHMALRLIEYFKLNIEYCIEQEFTFSWFEKQKKKVKGIIDRNPEMQYSRLLQNSNIRAKYLNEILGHLKATGEIEELDGRRYIRKN